MRKAPPPCRSDGGAGAKNKRRFVMILLLFLPESSGSIPQPDVPPAGNYTDHAFGYVA